LAAYQHLRKSHAAVLVTVLPVANVMLLQEVDTIELLAGDAILLQEVDMIKLPVADLISLLADGTTVLEEADMTVLQEADMTLPLVVNMTRLQVVDAISPLAEHVIQQPVGRQKVAPLIAYRIKSTSCGWMAVLPYEVRDTATHHAGQLALQRSLAQ
jgi:hypothetical protein